MAEAHQEDTIDEHKTSHMRHHDPHRPHQWPKMFYKHSKGTGCGTQSPKRLSIVAWKDRAKVS